MSKLSMVSKYFLTLFIALIIPHFVFAQNNQAKCACSKKDKSNVRDYFEQIAVQDKFISDCNQKYLESLQNKPNALPKRISGFFPTARSLPKPHFPQIARDLKISGTVTVEIIFDEQGFVINAKAISGKKIFRKSAEQAACASKFTPVQYCDKPVKQQGIIRYNFVF